MRLQRGLLIGLPALVLIVGGAATVYWYIVARQLGDGFTAWANARRAAGWSVASASPHFAGWPRSAVLVLPDLRLSGGEPDIPGGISWRASRAEISIDLLHPHAITIDSHGVQHVGSVSRPGWPFRAAELRALLPLRDGEPPDSADITVRNLRGGAAGLVVGAADVHIAFDPDAPRGQPDKKPALVIGLIADAISLPSGLNWPLGAQVASLKLDGSLNRLFPSVGTLRADAEAWRTAGGEVAIHRLEMRWGPMHGVLSATLSLDAALQPVVGGELAVTNYAPTLDALAAHRVIGNDAAFAAKAVLSLLAAVPPAGGAPQVAVPFAIADRTVTVRGIPLVRLLELRWPSQ
ncbi:MAG: DUF2125 domain-containing protein [Acetobacteraceae bacterium]